MRCAVYPGTFDPLTFGHLDIISRGAVLFDQVVVSILHNPSKQPLFSLTERMEQVRWSVRDISNVTVDNFSGLLVDYYRQNGFHCIIRGIRNQADVQNEMQMTQMNESLDSSVQTVFLPTRPDFLFISSTLVKDVALHGGDVHHLVPPHVQDALQNRYDQKRTD